MNDRMPVHELNDVTDLGKELQSRSDSQLSVIAVGIDW